MGSSEQPDPSPRGDALRDASSAHESHARYLNAYMDSMHAASKAQLALQRQVAQVYSEFQEAVAELQREVQDRGIQAFQAYADDLRSASQGGEAAQKCREAYDAYVDAARQLGAAQTDAERTASDAYTEYTTAIAEQREDSEIRERAEAVQRAHLAAVRSRYEMSDIRQRAADAQQQFARLLQDAQVENQQLAADATQKYRRALQSVGEQSDAQRRYQAALHSFREQMRTLQDHAQQVMLDAQLKSLHELKSAWEKVGGRAE
jgi:hypothetical protein